MNLSKEEHQLLSCLPRQQYILEKVIRNIPTAHPSKELFFPGKITKREASILDHFANLGSFIDHSEPQKNRPYQYGDNENTTFCFDVVDVPLTRFSNGKPVWYGSADLETSKAEVIFHLKRQALKELAGTADEIFIDFERVVFEGQVDFNGVDLSTQVYVFPGLIENGPPYPYCSAVVNFLNGQGCEGLIFASVRRSGGINYGIFERNCIKFSKATCYFSVRIFKDGLIEVCGELYIELT